MVPHGKFGHAVSRMAVVASLIVAFGGPAQAQESSSVGAEQAAKTVRRPIRLGSAKAAQLIYCVYPSYPKEAKKKHLEGNVRISFVIEADGSVTAQALSGNPILAKAAIEAIRQWRYRPTLFNGEPVAVKDELEMRFHRHKWAVDSAYLPYGGNAAQQRPIPCCTDGGCSE